MKLAVKSPTETKTSSRDGANEKTHRIVRNEETAEQTERSEKVHQNRYPPRILVKFLASEKKTR